MLPININEYLNKCKKIFERRKGKPKVKTSAPLEALR